VQYHESLRNDGKIITIKRFLHKRVGIPLGILAQKTFILTLYSINMNVERSNLFQLVRFEAEMLERP
jgi:hypothetical protein